MSLRHPIPGDVLLAPLPEHQSKPHRTIVLTRPDSDLNLLLAMITTHLKWKDDTVVLTVGDHPSISHTSVINYSDMQLVSVITYNRLYNYASKHYSRMNTNLLRTIQKGIFRSGDTPLQHKQYAAKNMKCFCDTGRICCECCYPQYNTDPEKIDA